MNPMYMTFVGPVNIRVPFHPDKNNNENTLFCEVSRDIASNVGKLS